MVRFLVIAAICLGAGGCGLIDSDITRFDLRVSDKRFTVDTSEWNLTADASFPSIPCAGTPGICSTGIDQVCGNDAACFGSCDG